MQLIKLSSSGGDSAIVGGSVAAAGSLTVASCQPESTFYLYADTKQPFFPSLYPQYLELDEGDVALAIRLYFAQRPACLSSSSQPHCWASAQ